MVSEKYIAGFLDGDGCIAIKWKGGLYKPLLHLSFHQKTSKDEVIELIKSSVKGGCIYYQIINDVSYTSLVLSGKYAEMLLYRIKKHLVIKKLYAEKCLDIISTRKPYPNWKEMARRLKSYRKEMALVLPNYPSRKWMAGYIDADGCFHAKVPNKNSGSTRIDLAITAIYYDRQGLDLIKRVFGGSIGISGPNKKCTRLVLVLSPTKAKRVHDYCGKYLIVKKDQFDFINGCANMGNYRDGKTIKEILKQLKARDYRLNEPKVNIKDLLSQVEEKRWGWLMRKSAQEKILKVPRNLVKKTSSCVTA